MRDPVASSLACISKGYLAAFRVPEQENSSSDKGGLLCFSGRWIKRAPASSKTQQHNQSSTFSDFCFFSLLKNLGHGINGAGIQEVLPMVHKAKRVPCGFGAFWDSALPKLPNRRIRDSPETGRLMVNGVTALSRCLRICVYAQGDWNVGR
jgi:hypothetical protein